MKFLILALGLTMAGAAGVNCIAARVDCENFCKAGHSSVKSFECSNDRITCDCSGGFGYGQERVKKKAHWLTYEIIRILEN